MANSLRSAALILAAGSARRFGRDKQFALIGGKPAILITASNFLSCRFIEEIVIAFSKNNFSKGKKLFAGFDRVKVVLGGDTRMASLKNAYEAVSTDAGIICVHDGARPFANAALIEKLIKAASKFKASAPVVALKDTVKKISGGKIVSTIDRKTHAAVQTPQCYKREIFEKMLSLPESNTDLTDDSQLLEKLSIKAAAVESVYENFKITTPEDLILAEALYEKNSCKKNSKKTK